MADGSETVWRNALTAKGKDWVLAELRRRPGLPGDAVYDIVFEEPLPTREFCQRWCAEEENRLVRFSWEKAAALIFLILTIVCSVGAVTSWNETTPQQGRSVAATKSAPQPAPMRGSGQITNDVPGATSPGAAGSSATGSSPPPLCAYQTYETAECKTQK
ncbi:MAG: hypothetical protein WAL10_28150 [Acetobacteraceae bacterium]|jgi:hypothetical protein